MENFAFQFYKNIREPKFICAPMVDQSELAFRMLTRKYGAQLCYTPMLHSKMMVTDKNYKKQNFTTCKEDRPLIVQFCGNDPEILLKAAKMVEDECDAVDINLGCPQGIARRGHYGSFLLKEPQLIKKIVETLTSNLKIPVTCKIRMLPSEEETLKLAKLIEDAGCSLLTVHGRTKEQNKQTVGSCNWDIITKIKQVVKIPVFANGGSHSYDDVLKCLETTKVEGVMSAESLLENPALFSGKIVDLDDLASEYLNLCKIYETDSPCIRAHLFKILYTGLQIHTDLRDRLVSADKFEKFMDITLELKNRRINMNKLDKFGWYQRHLEESKNIKDQPSDKGEQEKQSAVLLTSNPKPTSPVSTCDTDMSIDNLFS